MTYLTPDSVHNDLESYYESLVDKLEYLEIADEDVRETSRLILTGSLAHLHYIFDNIFFHPLYGNFTREDPINMNYAFKLSCLGFFVSTYDEKNMTTALLLDDAFEVLASVIEYDRARMRMIIKNQLEDEKHAAQDNEEELSLSVFLSALDMNICGYTKNTRHPFKALSTEDAEIAQSRMMRISLLGYREFFRTLAHDEMRDDEDV